jgi:cation diffusion facilitator CzcD-associated flavoprotein CzcO
MYYSPSKEIWEYIRRVADEEGMMKYIRLKTAVSKAVWQEDKSKWVIHLVERNANDEIVKEWDEECDMFLNGAGVLKYV